MMSDRKIYFAALAVVVILFFGSCIYGYTASIQMPEAADEIVVTFQSSTTELDSSAPAQLSWQIFFNNLKVCLILFLGGMTFGAATLFVLVSNGYVIGSISGVMLRGYDVSVFAATIVPHGIFEIPALILSLSCGLYLCRCVSDNVRHKATDTIGNVVKQIIRVVAFHIFPLLLVAAFIEAYITPHIMNMFL